MGIYRFTVLSFVRSIYFVPDVTIYIRTRDPAEHLRFVNPCILRTLAKFKFSWLASAIDNWNALPADLILKGDFVADTIYLRITALYYMHVLTLLLCIFMSEVCYSKSVHAMYHELYISSIMFLFHFVAI